MLLVQRNNFLCFIEANNLQGPDVLDATYMEYVFNLTHPTACRGFSTSPRSKFPGSRTARITLGTVVCDDSMTNQQGALKIVGL